MNLALLQTVKVNLCKWIKLEEDEKYVDLFSCYEKLFKKQSSVLKAVRKALVANYKVVIVKCS